MIRVNCKNCGKPIEVTTLSTEGPYDLHDQPSIPYWVKVSLDGTVVFCGGCKGASRFEYDYVDDVVNLIGAKSEG